MKNEKMAVVVMTCDKYCDTWEVFIKLFRKYFPDCVYPVVLSTETISCAENLPFDLVVHSEKKEWSGRLKDTLEQIGYDYVLLMLDDFWIERPVNYKLFEEDVDFLINNDNIGAIYLDYCNWRFLSEYSETYLEWPQNRIYRANTRSGIWRADFLKSVLHETEDIWEFERNCLKKSNINNYVVLCRKNKYFKYTFGVTAGKYERKAVRLAQREMCKVDLSYREQRTLWESIVLKIRNWVFDLNPELISRIVERFKGKIRGNGELDNEE